MTTFTHVLNRCIRTSLIHQFTRKAICGTHDVTTDCVAIDWVMVCQADHAGSVVAPSYDGD